MHKCRKWQEHLPWIRIILISTNLIEKYKMRLNMGQACKLQIDAVSECQRRSSPFSVAYIYFT